MQRPALKHPTTAARVRSLLRWRARCSAMALAALIAASARTVHAQYVPPAGEWEYRLPGQVGLDSAAVRAAVEFAIGNESSGPRDLLANHARTFGREPHGEAVGPFRDRGDPAGIIVKAGYIVAEWGDPERVDLTFSVTKSFLSSTVGLAYDRGIISDLHEPVHLSMAPVVTFPEQMLIEPFASSHNRRITWDHLLRQTSDWEGTLWGKPDWADRPRGDLEEWRARPRHEPGAVYMYNDVRVNAHFFLNTDRRPLPSAPEEAFYHLGAGNNVIYVDPVNDLVIVMRWISSLRAADGVVQRVLSGARSQ